MLFAAQYFDRPDADEAEIRRLATRLNDAVDWRWMLGRGPFIVMGWKPESGFIPSQWDRYNEATLLYLLALGSPTFPVDPEIWARYTPQFRPELGRSSGGPSTSSSRRCSGTSTATSGSTSKASPTRGCARKGIDLFENSRRATVAQRNYAIANPGRWRGYDANVWGLTACDGPGDFRRNIGGREREFFSYSARGPGDRDDGTLAPTAAAGSIAFAPELVLPALAAMQARYGAAIYGRYGFFDSFNPTLADPALAGLIREGAIVPGVAWVDDDILGIDQGPIVAMIANYRDGLIWRRMRGSAPVVAGLRRAGFAGGWLG